MNNSRITENAYRDRMMALIPGSEREVVCHGGRIDLLTPTEIIEFKRFECWRDGIGQLLDYGRAYPEHKKRLHILLPAGMSASKVESDAKPVCGSIGIDVTWEHEDNAIVVSRQVAGLVFDTMAELHREVASIRAEAPLGLLRGDHKTFILALVNLAPWVDRRFGGKVDKVQLVEQDRHGKTQKVFMVFSSKGNSEWLNINIDNYVKQAFAHADRLPQVVSASDIFTPDVDVYVGGEIYLDYRRKGYQCGWGAVVAYADGRIRCMYGLHEPSSPYLAHMNHQSSQMSAIAALEAAQVLFSEGIERVRIKTKSEKLVRIVTSTGTDAHSDTAGYFGLTPAFLDEVNRYSDRIQWQGTKYGDYFTEAFQLSREAVKHDIDDIPNGRIEFDYHPCTNSYSFLPGTKLRYRSLTLSDNTELFALQTAASLANVFWQWVEAWLLKNNRPVLICFSAKEKRVKACHISDAVEYLKELARTEHKDSMRFCKKHGIDYLVGSSDPFESRSA